MFKIKTTRYFAIMLSMVLSLIACNSPNNELKTSEPDPAYQEWRAKAEKMLGSRAYVFPEYDAEAGPLELIYDPSSPDFEFELYRSPDYRISKELSGVRTVHDRYYACSVLNNEPDEFSILSPYRSEPLPIPNDTTSKHQNGGVTVYEISEDPEQTAHSKQIAEILKKKGIESAKVLIVHMERHLNVEIYLPVHNQTVRLMFTVRDLEEMETFAVLPSG